MNTDHDNNKRLIDPEPFGTILAIVGAAGGIASVLSALKIYLPKSPIKVLREIHAQLDKADEITNEILKNMESINVILKNAEITNDRKFHPRTAIFIKRDQYLQYMDVVDRIYNNLRKLVRITLELDQLLPRMERSELEKRTDMLMKIQDQLDSLLENRERYIDDTLVELYEVVNNIKSLINTIR